MVIEHSFMNKSYTAITGTEGAEHAAERQTAKQNDGKSEGVIFKNCAPFINSISKISSTQVDNAKYLDVVMPIYTFIECSDDYSKTSGSLLQYYRDQTGEVDNAAKTDSKTFKSKVKTIGKTPDSGNTMDVKLTVPLKYLSNFG